VDFIADDLPYTLELFRVKTKITPKYDDNLELLTFHVDFSAVADQAYNHILTDSYTGDNVERNDRFKKLAQEQIKLKLADTIIPVVMLGGDIFNLEDKLKHRDITAWIKVEDDWHEVLSNADFTFNAMIKIV
jgi:hypothetical protein